jgi:hypothetical protein
MIAFWAYDGFPYILGGKVTETTDEGRVRIDGYGGYTFKPKFYLPDKEGKELILELRSIANEREEKLIDLKRDFDFKLKNLLSNYPVGFDKET